MGQGPRPWAKGHGHGPGPTAMGQAQGLGPSGSHGGRTAVRTTVGRRNGPTGAHGPGPWAKAHGPGPWARAHGPRILIFIFGTKSGR